jgi:CRP-like cAMP-binding protein
VSDWLARAVAGAGRPVALESGETLFHRGDATRGMFLLENGRLRLCRQGADGTEAVMQTVLPGETFAEASLFSDVYHCDAVAETASVVVPLPKQCLLAALEKDAGFAAGFARRLAGQLQEARARSEVRAVRSADERVLSALLLRADDGGTVRLGGTLKGFAAEIGLTHETLYRSLARLERDGRLRRDGTAFRLS